MICRWWLFVCHSFMNMQKFSINYRKWFYSNRAKQFYHTSRVTEPNNFIIPAVKKIKSICSWSINCSFYFLYIFFLSFYWRKSSIFYIGLYIRGLHWDAKKIKERKKLNRFDFFLKSKRRMLLTNNEGISATFSVLTSSQNRPKIFLNCF